MNERDVIDGITETLYDYCQFTDEARADDFANLFCEDATFDMGYVMTGRDHIRKVAVRMMRSWTATSHYLTNIRVRPVSDGKATSLSSAYAWHRRTDGSEYEVWTRFVDRFRLEPDGRWRFEDHRIEMAGSRGVDSTGMPPIRRQALPPDATDT
jgi:ketosteroid isomerase-like protein